MSYADADLSPQELEKVERYKAAFRQHDTDHSGKLSRAEIEALLAKSNDPGKPSVDNICCLADEDNDGQISEEEFLTALVGCSKKSVFGYAFRSYDKDHSGYLDRDEFEQMLSNDECFQSEKEREAARRLLNEIDTDQDGRICIDEYLESLSRVACGKGGRKQ